MNPKRYLLPVAAMMLFSAGGMRKGPVIIRFKINKAPAPASMNELRASARRVADGL